MSFNLTRPCAKCPFRIDCPKGWLGEERAEEIVSSLLMGQTFTCHETTEFDDDGEHVPSKEEEHCAGAMILLEHQDMPNQMMRICERIGVYDRRKMDMDAPVFDDPEAFIEHHAKE